MCTTGVLRLADGTHVLFKNKDFGRRHLDDRLIVERDVFGVLGMTTWAGVDPSLDEFSGLSIGANRHGLLCCDSNVLTKDGLENYDVMTEVALREGTDVRSAAAAVERACARRETSWGNLVMIDARTAASVEIRGRSVVVTELDRATARSNHHVVMGEHPSQEDTVTSEPRRVAAQRRLDAATSLDDVFALQRAHDDGDTGVCNHALHTTVYSYVLTCRAGAVELHVAQGQPCRGAPRIQLRVPLGDAHRAAAVDDFISRYPSATKHNYATAASR